MRGALLRGYGADDIRAVERPLIDAGEPLMLRAAHGLAEVALDRLGRRGRLGRLGADQEVLGDASPRVLVLVGAGDNGGDALYAAAEIAAAGVRVELALLGSRVHEEALAAALDAGATVLDPAGVPAALDAADLLLDGILGIGTTSPALRDPARSVVAAILARGDRRRPTVIAVDVPSGIHPDTGEVPDATVLPADVTVTFGAVKAGLLCSPARELAGEIVLVDIGLGDALAGVRPLVESGSPG